MTLKEDASPDDLRALGDMLAGVAHEINNPLTSILGYAQLLLARTDLPEEAREDITSILEESRRGAKIVHGISSMARRRGGKREICDISEILADTVKINAQRISQTGIRLDLSLERNIGRTMADPGQLQQVFMNLITNAVQALQRKNSGERSLRIAARQRGETAVITIEDTGPGIAPEHMARIFDPFFTTRERGQGMGLGLSLSRAIIAGHGGTIRAESRVGEGATFRIDLPIVEPAPIMSYEAEPAGKTPPGKGEVIVVVDDERTNRDIFKRFLEGRGYRVEAFSNVEDAIQALPGLSARAVISDFKLPGKTGRDLYAHLGSRHPDLAKKFILISGDVLSEEVSRFIEETRVAVIEKPFALDRLAERLADIIHR
ncbi:response regulator [bacterium]|nr:response regulator [bacterium]